MESASRQSRRPARPWPMPASNLMASAACMAADDAHQRREHAHRRATQSPRRRPPRETGSDSRARRQRRSNTLICPSKRMAAPDTSGLRCATQAAIDGMAGGEVVAAIQHHVGLRPPARPAPAVEAADQRLDLGFGIRLGQHGRLPDSALAQPMRSVVCRIWRCRLASSTVVVVGQDNVPDPGRGQVKGGR